MSVVQTRGGYPHVYRNAVVPTTGVMHDLPASSTWIRVRTATFPVRLYFDLASFTDDVNYIEVPVAAAATPYGEWDGPLEIDKIWIRGVGGSASVELVAARRRG